MIIVGLSGGIGYGKSTFADYLATMTKNYRHWEGSDLISEVANDLRARSVVHPAPNDIPNINAWLTPLPAILKEHLHVSVDFSEIELTKGRLRKTPEKYIKLQQYLRAMQQTPSLTKITITQENKIQFRALQQWLGGYLVSQLGGIWYDEIVRRIESFPKLELATISGVRFPSDAAAIRHVGGSVLTIQRPYITKTDTTDLTERDRHAIVSNATVYNDGTLEQLKRCAEKVFTDLAAHTLANEYRASNF